MKILLATDGSDCSKVAAETLLAMRPRTDGEITVLHVMEPPHYWTTPAVPLSYQTEWRRLQHEMQAEAEGVAAGAIEQGAQILSGVGTDVKSMILHGHPAEVIIRTAGEIAADLVVVGAKGLTGIELFLLGSVSQKILKYAPCSVLVAKPPRTPDAPKIDKVLIATDGSDSSLAACRVLSSFQLQGDAEITVLHVIRQEHAWIPHSRAAHPALEEVHRLKLEDATRLVEDTKNCLTTEARVATSVREGDPTEQILKVTSEMNADLILMGAKGLSGIKSFLLGSVAQKVSRYSHRSVLLVRAPQETPSMAER